MINVILEDLNGEQSRVTVRNNGTTLYLRDGNNKLSLVENALRECLAGHQISIDRFDLTFISFNDAAKEVLKSKKIIGNVLNLH